MRLLCNGVALDLSAGERLQFTHENPLFAFDNISCERTTQFKLPRTATNDRVFSLARVPAYSGEGMRRRFAAELQAGVVVKSGYLYVSSWNGKEYQAVFVTGEFLGLQALREAGEIRDYWGAAGSILWDASNVRDANTTEGQASVALTRYLSTGVVHPSFDLSDVMNTAYNRLTGRTFASRVRGFRLIPKEVQGIGKEPMQISYAGTGVRWSDVETVTAAANTIAINTELAPVIQVASQVLVAWDGQYNDHFWSIRQLVPQQNIVLTFPEDLPDNYFLMSIRDTSSTGGHNPLYSNYSQTWFLGGYIFRPGTSTVIVEGTPLKGRSITIERNTPFVLVDRTKVGFGVVPNNYPIGFSSWSDLSYSYNFTLQIEGEKIRVGDYVRILDILPDLTLIDLFKIYAALTGTILNYDETNGVTFDELDVPSWAMVDITSKLMAVQEVARTFGNYAQRNLLKFKSGADVPENMHVENVYTVDNDNIEEEKTLLEVPYSEGVLTVNNNTVVARFDVEKEQTLFAAGIGIAIGNTTTVASPYMQRISMPRNANLQAICAASTQVKAQAWMNLYEYSQITPKTKILLQGSEYVWTSRQWQKGVAQFVLAKIA